MFTGQSMPQSANTHNVSSKELAYISDCLKNEELIAKLAAEGAANSSSPHLKQKLAQIARDRLNGAERLLHTLQQQTRTMH